MPRSVVAATGCACGQPLHVWTEWPISKCVERHLAQVAAGFGVASAPEPTQPWRHEGQADGSRLDLSLPPSEQLSAALTPINFPPIVCALSRHACSSPERNCGGGCRGLGFLIRVGPKQVG